MAYINPCKSGCAPEVWTECVLSADAYPCIGTAKNATLKTILRAIDTILCNSNVTQWELFNYDCLGQYTTAQEFAEGISAFVCSLSTDFIASAITIVDTPCQTSIAQDGATYVITKGNFSYIDSLPSSPCDNAISLFNVTGKTHKASSGSWVEQGNIKGNRLTAYEAPTIFDIPTGLTTLFNYDLDPVNGNQCSENGESFTIKLTLVLKEFSNNGNHIYITISDNSAHIIPVLNYTLPSIIHGKAPTLDIEIEVIRNSSNTFTIITKVDQFKDESAQKPYNVDPRGLCSNYTGTLVWADPFKLNLSIFNPGSQVVDGLNVVRYNVTTNKF